MKTNGFVLGKVAAFAMGLTLLASCTQKSGPPTGVQIQLPAAISFSKLQGLGASSKISTASLSNISEINCYLIMVAGPEDDMKASTCHTNTSVAGTARQLPVGTWYGGHAASSSVSIEVPAGLGRQFYLIGMGATAGKCKDFATTGFDVNDVSTAYVIGESAPTDLIAGRDAVVKINASLNADATVNSCAGKAFDGITGFSHPLWNEGNSGPGPTPTPAPGTWPTITSLPSTPASSSSVTISGTVPVGIASAELYYDPTCSVLKASATAAQWVSGFGTLANSNAVTTFYVKTVTAAGVTSPCSTSLGSYTHDNIAPGTPVVAVTTPATSPSNVTNATIQISSLVSGDTVKLYLDNGCSSQYDSVVSAGATVNFTPTVSGDGIKYFSARAYDPAGNVSSCAVTNYVLDTTPPPAPSVSGVIGGTDANVDAYLTAGTTPTITWTLAGSASSHTVKVFNSSNTTEMCSNTGVSGGSTSHTITGCSLSNNQSYVARVYAYDAAGNSAYGNLAFTIDNAASAMSSVIASGPVIADGSSASNITITILNNNGIALSGVTPTISASGTNNNLSTCSPTDASGISTCSLSSTKAETKTISVNTPYSMSATTTFNAGTVAQLSFSSQPTSMQLGQFLPTMTVQAKDANGNLNSGFTGTITLSIDNNPGATSLFGLTSMAASSGSATFTQLQLGAAGNNYTLSATYSSVTGTSNSFNVNEVPVSIYSPSSQVGLSAKSHFTLFGGSGKASFNAAWGTVNSSGIYTAPPSGTTSDTVTATDFFSGNPSSKVLSIPGNGYFKWVSAGNIHACAISPTSKLFCWGNNESGQLGIPTESKIFGLTAIDPTENYDEVSAGDNHTCALTTTRKVKCWGGGFYGQLGNGTQTSNYVPTEIQGGLQYVKVVTGNYFTCAIVDDNSSVKCWGKNSSGQLGDGTTTNKLVPTTVSGLSSLTDIATTSQSNHVCAISGVTLKCWGLNSSKQLGDNTSTNRTTPVVIDSGVNYIGISVSGNHSCGIISGNTARCWGNGANGQLGRNSTAESAVPVAVNSGAYSEIFSGGDGEVHTCAFNNSDGQLTCWGANSSGQFGDTTTNGSLIPAAVSTTQFWKFSIGNKFSCGITQSTNLLYCWGNNRDGQLANGLSPSANFPAIVKNDTDKVSRGSSSFHNCSIDMSAKLHCRGSNDSKQISNTAAQHILDITPVDNSFNYVKVETSGNNLGSTCALSGNDLRCWGTNGSGQLGTGNTTPLTTPTTTVTDVADFTMGPSHTCKISASGELKCWGMNTNGQIGNGASGTNVLSPYTVSASGYSWISAGGFHTCGVTTGGTAKCWGYGGDGQLGNGLNSDFPNPTNVDGTDWAKVFAGPNRTCGIKTNGALWCWGSGLLGDPSGNPSNTPVQVDVGTLYEKVVFGTDHTCAMSKIGIVKCWGNNSYGQLGSPLAALGETTPFVFNPGVLYKDIGASARSTCAVTKFNVEHCFGSGTNGQLGIGSIASFSTTHGAPFRIP